MRFWTGRSSLRRSRAARRSISTLQVTTLFEVLQGVPALWLLQALESDQTVRHVLEALREQLVRELAR